MTGDKNMEVSIQGDKIKAQKVIDKNKINNEKQSGYEIYKIMDVDGDGGIFRSFV